MSECMAPGTATCGTAGMYVGNKCRGEICREWNRNRQRASRAGKTEAKPNKATPAKRKPVTNTKPAKQTRSTNAKSTRAESKSQTVAASNSIWEIPRLWPSSKSEPEYAGSHRTEINTVLNNLTSGAAWSVTFERDTPKQEVKDFLRLIKETQKANPDIDLQWQGENMKGFTYYTYVLYINIETEQEPEPEPETQYARTLVPSIPPNQTHPARARTSPSNPSLRFTFRNGNNIMCEIVMQGEPPCNKFAGDKSECTFTVDGHPVCEPHFQTVREQYPSRVKYKRMGQWISPAPIWR